MVITQDMMGGEWEQAARHMRIELEGWLEGRDIRTKLGLVDKAAQAADRTPTKGALFALDQAVLELERAVAQHEHRVSELRREAGYFVAAVHQARALAANQPNPKTPEELEAEETARLIALSEIGLDRLGLLYGIPEPRSVRHRK
jgi:hypothetical protein